MILNFNYTIYIFIINISYSYYLLLYLLPCLIFTMTAVIFCHTFHRFPNLIPPAHRSMLQIPPYIKENMNTGQFF